MSRTWTQAEAETVRKMFAAGKTDIFIGHKLKRSKYAIYRFRKKNNWRVVCNNRTEAVNLFDDGKTLAEISVVLGVDEKKVYWLLYNAGVIGRSIEKDYTELLQPWPAGLCYRCATVEGCGHEARA